ncbi:hypothetical protein KFU94_05000 [Chloroflexi bacterium TSY]|nr:hypothetical protein [Chloroflexi bacterium TSY]
MDLLGLPVDTYLWDTYPVGGGFATDYLSNRDGADPVILTLSAAEHTLTFYVREDGTLLDKFELEPVVSGGSVVDANEQAEMQILASLNAQAEKNAEKGESAQRSIFLPLVRR